MKKADAKLLEVEQIRKVLTKDQLKLIRRGLMKITTEPLRRVVGLKAGKLKETQAVRVVSGNYGISLGSVPCLLSFHQVSKQLDSLRADNGGRLPRMIRQGSLIQVASGTWAGFWKVTSVKESKAYGVSVDLAQPHMLSLARGNAKIPNMISEGLTVIDPPLVGVNAKFLGSV